MQTFARRRRRRASVRDAVHHAVGRPTVRPEDQPGGSNWPSWWGDTAPWRRKPRPLQADDPIFQMIGFIKGGPKTDIAVEKDKLIADALSAEFDDVS